LTTFGSPSSAGSSIRRHGVGNRLRIDQRLVSLHVDDDVAVERGGNLREPVGAAAVIVAGEAGFAAEALNGVENPQIVGGDDHALHRGRRSGASVDVLDHRTAVDLRERLAREACRTESSGDDGDGTEWKAVIDREASRRRVHDE